MIGEDWHAGDSTRIHQFIHASFAPVPYNVARCGIVKGPDWVRVPGPPGLYGYPAPDANVCSVCLRVMRRELVEGPQPSTGLPREPMVEVDPFDQRTGRRW